MAKDSKIRSDAKLLTFCLDTLKDYLSAECAFKENEYSAKEKSYYLGTAKGRELTMMNAHSLSVPVVQMKNEFLMACSLTFKKNNRTLDFKGISMQFFDYQKLLFRAEWDNWELKQEEKATGEDLKLHPQPHWHLADAEGIGITERVSGTFMEHISNFSFKQFEEKMRERTKRDLGRLHFFMQMDSTGGNELYLDLTSENTFKRWFSITIKSVNEELNLLTA